MGYVSVDKQVEEAFIDDPLFEKATLGIEIEAFLKTKPGKYLWETALEAEGKAMAEFLNANPADSKELIRIQQDALVARRVREWLLTAVNAGELAEQQIRDQEEVDLQ